LRWYVIIGNSLLILFFILFLTPWHLVLAGGKIYQPNDTKYGQKKAYTRNQQINRGEKEKIQYTTCRLMKRIKSRSTGRQACIYQGGNKTYTLMYENNCPSQYKCKYNPWSKEPSIDDVISSLNSIKK
tara:strand:+ start:133 stop:516 length:384 start_codon:yes stop_codon:yes gene_type:complete